MKKFILLIPIILGGCVPYTLSDYVPDFLDRAPTVNENKLITAAQYIDYEETTHRSELRDFTGVDPVRTEWCAAFINAVLRESGIPGSESVSEYPLTARSFLKWGTKAEEPLAGDIVVFPRGDVSWQGHVGFYLNTVNINGVEYYQILGGNQSNKVSIELYPASKAISIRRHATL
jgi:uncharacterized protein (TIGR02594 family)